MNSSTYRTGKRLRTIAWEIHLATGLDRTTALEMVIDTIENNQIETWNDGSGRRVDREDAARLVGTVRAMHDDYLAGR